MKFCKKYEAYMQGQGKKKLPGVGFKKLKKILKRCRKQIHSHAAAAVHDDVCRNLNGDVIPHFPRNVSACQQQCPVCDGTFFPLLLEEMSAVVGFFNQRAQRLLDLHLASGFNKCMIWLIGMLQGNHVAMIQEGRDLVTYAIFNAMARGTMCFLCYEFFQIHYSKQGQAFKSQARSMHIEILQSPWLCELMAFHINLRASDEPNSVTAQALFDGCSLLLCEGKPSLHCELFDSVELDIDLTCGHMFCYLCACKAASVTIVEGLKAAMPEQKCPICREVPSKRSGGAASSVRTKLSRILGRKARVGEDGEDSAD